MTKAKAARASGNTAHNWADIMDSEPIQAPSQECRTCGMREVSEAIREALRVAADRRAAGKVVPDRRWLLRKVKAMYPVYTIGDSSFRRHLNEHEAELVKQVWG